MAAVLRDAEAGQTFTITVRGRPVAQLGPTDDEGYPRVDVPWEKVRESLATPIDDEFAADLDAAEAPVYDPSVDD